MGLHRKESRLFNGFSKILTKTIKITKTEIETKEKPQILHFQVKNTGFCQQSVSPIQGFFLIYLPMQLSFYFQKGKFKSFNDQMEKSECLFW